MSDNPGLIESLEPVVRAFQAMNVDYYVSGSVASSFHGASRSTLDVDLVANLMAENLEDFVGRLGAEYYLSKPAIVEAIANKSCFNLIHLASSFKIDIFIFKNRPFDVSSMNRAQPRKVEVESTFEFRIASPEDTILSKLEWYRLGNEVSERQWDDVVRVMKILGEKADLDYLTSHAAELNVADLLDRLLGSVN